MKVFIDERFEDVDLKMWDEDDELIKINVNPTIEEVCVLLGKFPSKTQARKNGFYGPIPPGITEYRIGKTHFCVHLPFDDWLPYNEWLAIDKQKYPEDYK